MYGSTALTLKKTPEKELLIKLIQNDYPIFLCPVIYQEILQGIREEKIFEQIAKESRLKIYK